MGKGKRQFSDERPVENEFFETGFAIEGVTVTRLPKLTTSVLKTIRQQQLFLEGAPVLVAVSGGADSMALLHLLHSLSPKLKISLYAATFDHGLRGSDSAADAGYVQKTAEAWGIPVIVGHAALDPTAPGVEARARSARYTFLAETAQTVGASLVATGHHADDQAETVLLHLIRGGGIHGLGGLRPQAAYPLAGFDSLTLIRPLLGVTRADIEQYCEEQGITYRHDVTNDSPDTLRNRLRLETLPYLAQLNPRIVETLNRFAEIAALEDVFIQEAMHQQTIDLELQTDQLIILPRKVYINLPTALRHRWLLDAAARLRDSERASDKSAGWLHLSSADEVMMTGEVGAVAQLPGFVQVRLGSTQINVEVSNPNDQPK
jgi:tRNA(Ile)-lysidine synthase